MIRRLIASAFLGGLAAACTTTVDQMDQRGPGADLRARAHVYCRSLGVDPGSDAYILCRRRIDATASADETSWRTAVGDKRALESGVAQGALQKP
jgi:hypothetical protein